MRYKSFPYDVKVDLEKNEIEGYASIFDNMDSMRDIVKPGAFKKTIQERLPKGLIKVLWQHRDPMGVPKHMEEDSTGLYTVSKISETNTNKERLQLVKDGVVDRMSIGYDIIKREIVDDDDNSAPSIWHLKELKLYEYSPVTFAANEEAVILGAKQMAELDALLMDLPERIKEGRVLSSQNRQLIEDAIAALQALLENADSSQQPDDSTADGDDDDGKSLDFEDCDPDTVQSILQEMKRVREQIQGG